MVQEEYYNSITKQYEPCCLECGCPLGYLYPYKKYTDCLNK